MNRLIASVFAVGALAAAVPALAQPVAVRPAAVRPVVWTGIGAREAGLNARIDQGVRSGALTRREAVRLRAEFGDLVRLEARYRTNGLSPGERADLDKRFERLSAQVFVARHNDRVRAG
jgi:hypothetical protein